MKKITYTKKDLIRKVSNNLNISKDEIQIILESILNTISNIICEEESLSRIEIRNFGVFEVNLLKLNLKQEILKRMKKFIFPQEEKFIISRERISKRY